MARVTRQELERILRNGIKHHHVTVNQTIGNTTSRLTQPEMAELLAQYLDTHLPTGKKCKCGKEIRGKRVKWCSDRCQERLTAKK